MSKKFQTNNAITLAFAHFTHDLYSAFLAPVLPILIERLKINYFLIGVLTFIQRAPSIFMPLIGLAADRLQVRYIVIVTPVITAVLMSLLGVVPSYTFLAILLFMVGISSALFHVPSPVMVKEVSGDKIGLGMSFYMIGGELARSLGPLIILGCISLWGFEYSYRLIPFGVVASVLLYFRLRKIKVLDDIKKENKPSRISKTIKQFLPLLLIILGITFFRAILKSSLTIFLPVYLDSQGETLWFSGISLSVLEAAGVAGTFLAGWLSDIVGRKRLLIFVSVLTPVLMWFFTQSEGYMIFPLLILLGFFIFATSPIILALVMDNKSDRPSFINGMYMMINFIGSSVAALLVGFISDVIGLQLTFEISAFVAFGAVPFALMLKEKNG